MAMTLRLTENEQDALELFKQKYGHSTTAAAIKHMIMNIEGIIEDSKYHREGWDQAKEELDQVKKMVTQKVMTDQWLFDYSINGKR